MAKAWQRIVRHTSMGFLMAAGAACGVFLYFQAAAAAKPKLVYGQCKGEGCEVAAIDGARSLGKGPGGELKAYFVVLGFTGDNKKIEWSRHTNVEWVWCSRVTPVVLGFGAEGFTGWPINHGNEPPYMAAVTSTSIYEYLCPVEFAAPDIVDDAKVEALLKSIRAPGDLLEPEGGN